MEPWIVSSKPSERYPLWTRANVGEVFPDPVAPLTFSVFMRDHTEQAWRDAMERMGAFTQDEFAPDNMETLGVFGGYCYLNASVTRILGERAPGLSAQMMDDLFYGAQPGIPPYEPAPGDQNEERTAAIGAVFQWALTTDRLEVPAESEKLVDSIRAARPDLEAMSNEELWAYSRNLYITYLGRFFSEHIFITFLATLPVGVLGQICAAVGRAGEEIKLISGVGDVASAAPSMAMWKLGRMVAADPALAAEFDKGVDGLLGRLQNAGPAGAAFLGAFRQFIKDFGSRGPNEWEVMYNTWETRPELALAAIDRMRLAPADADPAIRNRQMAAERERITGEISAMLAGDPETQGMFLAAARAATLFQAGRERTKTNNVKLIQEARMAMHLLGKRLVDQGLADNVNDFGLVLASEMDDWLNDPRPLRDELARRRALMETYAGIQEPFVFWGNIPDPSTWAARGATEVEAVKAGDVLQGFPGCPGSVTGVARVVLDPIDPTALEPGDILVAPITDPSWTPLFVSAGGVIVDVGAAQSHAMIVSRELGIPCVPSVTGATRRIPDGATVTVNGDAGTVTIVALP
ncbi:MAG: phosphoenolpyruvate-utilizing protein [Dehalococcoidia bacterium]|nr:phosphoenolpyruvate-utilizing protein [Dehalococcoidia bacterium]